MGTRNMNRMVGMALGLFVGSLPQALLMQTSSSANDERQRKVFTHVHLGPVAYLTLMFFFFAIPMYGSLAKGAKWGYACLLWASFGGCQMLVQWELITPMHANHISLLDSYAGCLIIFIVDFLFAYLIVGISS